MNQSAFDDPTKQIESVAEGPVNAGRRFVVKGGLTFGITALGGSSHLRLGRRRWLRKKKTVRNLRF